MALFYIVYNTVQCKCNECIFLLLEIGFNSSVENDVINIICLTFKGSLIVNNFLLLKLIIYLRKELVNLFL